ncbi:MAG: SBBP repeat-containing protein [Ignavibacteriaceae bacterium]
MKSIIVLLILFSFVAFGQNSSSIQLNWSTTYPAVDSSNNFLTANSKNTAVDNAGNLYVVADELSDVFPFYRFKLTKYSSSGVILWQVKSNNIESNNYTADIVVSDNYNNIYVAAHTLENNIPGGLLILKFNPKGTLLWVEKYNGNLINSFASPIDLKFDRSGNIILLGYGGRVDNNVAVNDSLLLIKYSNFGFQVWTAETSSDSIIYKAHCVIDDSNNIFVSGENETFSHRIRFVKYNDQGKLVWSSSYFNKSYYYTAIGAATNFNDQHFVTASATTLNFNSKWFTIMLDKNGQLKWGRYEDKDSSSDVYETPLLIKSDDNFINVLGYENKNNFSNFFLTKYDSDGNKVSEQAYIDTTNEFVQKVVLDSSDNLYTAGFIQNPDKIYLIKFDSSGNKIWSNNFLSGGIKGINTGMNLVLNDSEYIFLTSEDSSKKSGINEVITSKYNVINGNEIWTVRANEYSQHRATSMVVDNKSNTFLTGWIQNGKGDNKDFITIKYDSQGQLLWGNRYYGPAKSTDISKAIAIDNDGNVYVTGESMGMSSNFDFITIKYTSIGVEQWRERYDGGNIDIPQTIAVGPEGNIYVSGSSMGTGSNYDFVTIKYNKDGQLQWIQRFNDAVNGKDSVVSMAIDRMGNIYVAGTSDSTASLHTFLLIKYSSSGGRLWTKRFHNSKNDWEYAKKLIIDSKNNIYITGTGYNSNTNDDIIIVKFDTDGILQWDAIWNDSQNSMDEVTDIKADKNGNIYLTGYGAGNDSKNDFITLKYDSSGNQKWAVTFNSSKNTDDFAVSLALDYQRNSYVVGYNQNNSYILVKYDSNGVKLWGENLQNNASANGLPVSVFVDDKGNIFIGGFTGNLLWSMFDLTEYSQPGFVPTGISESINKDYTYQLYQNFPNPFNPVTTIKYTIRRDGFVYIKLYDVLGREIKTLVAREETAGNHEIKFDGSDLSSGIYFYTMSVENYFTNN